MAEYSNPVERLARWRETQQQAVTKRWPKVYLPTPAEQHELNQIANPSARLTRFRAMRDAAEAAEHEGA
jgi:hypothetical protein